jgi:hypothetical protein
MRMLLIWSPFVFKNFEVRATTVCSQLVTSSALDLAPRDLFRVLGTVKLSVLDQYALPISVLWFVGDDGLRRAAC